MLCVATAHYSRGLGWHWAPRRPVPLRFLARRAQDRKRGRDGTRYSRFHASNFLSHHLAKIVTAAVYSDAQHIEEGVYGLKTRAHDLAQADAAECAA